MLARGQLLLNLPASKKAAGSEAGRYLFLVRNPD
jgi:hypothetical protein